MTRRILLFLAALAAAAQVPGPRTLRLDYVHTGMAAEEHFALDGVVLEGEWPGPLDRWTDESNLGKYYFQVLDRATNRVIYSRGFASIYGEWETTGEAKQQRRAFSESVRFPAPTLPVQVVIKKRGPRNEFREVWSIVVDPSDAGVERGPPPKLNVWAVMQNGAPRDKVDLLLMGDGYTATEMEKWHRDARRLTETLFTASPFKEHRQDFNVWAVDAPAEESGVARPSDGIFRHSPRAPRMTPSGRSATSSRSTTSGCARRRRPRRTNSSRSWSTTASMGAAASSISSPPSPPTTRSRPTFSCTNSATISRGWPTNTIRPMSPTVA